MDYIQNTIIPLLQQYGSYSALIAFLAAFGETLLGLGWLLPGSTILLVMGLLAGQGYLNISTVLIFGILGAWIGDSVNYSLGKKYGMQLLRKRQFHISESLIQRAHDFLEKYGAKSVFLSRFLPGLKESVPFIAGSVQMDRKKFFIWNLLGAIGWSFEFIGIGYIFSSSLALAQTWVNRSIVILAVIVITIITLWLLKRFLTYNIPIALAVLKGAKRGFLKSKPVENFSKKHPKFIHFLQQRFEQKKFTGLPLTILAVTFIYVLLLFGGIIEDFLTKDSIVYLDHIIANLMAQWRTPELIELFSAITYLGRELTVFIVLLALSLCLLLYKRYRELIALLISVSGSTVFLWFGKLGFHRARPDIALYFEPTFSFPSGHATIAVSLYGFLGYLFIHNAKTLQTKVNILFATTLLILAIGFSRIYLGEHYLSDVYAGFLLGTLWVIVAVTILKWLEYRNLFPALKELPYAKIVSIASLSIAALFVLFYNYTYPYKAAPHKKETAIVLHSPTDYFSKKENHFVYNLLGLQSRPVNIILYTNKSPCPRLIQKGWKPIPNTMILQPPLFWQAKEPECRLYKKEGSKTYLLDIWNSNLFYQNKKVYIASTDAVVGKKWDIVPLYLKDLSKARIYAANAIKNIYTKTEIQDITLAAPAILQHFNAQVYFYDGKSTVIKVIQP